MSDSDFFASAYRALMDNGPLRWQQRLYDRMRSGNLPVSCDLPTGLGKTSVIPIWLIAFASQVQAGLAPKLPRRLIYVVNRRTVVDQATEIAERLRNRMLGREIAPPGAVEPLERLRKALERSRADSTGEPIAISTLRGELADNEEWKADPARPAIIVGTIDMIGSKLLFSGYGDGFRARPHHAGLIGQDALIIHDEAHLTPAFNALLLKIAEEQRRESEPLPVHVLELSATASSTSNDSVLSLEPEDEGDAVVRVRLDARKSMLFHEANSGDLEEILENAARTPKRATLAARIGKLALRHRSGAQKVLVYVRSPEIAQQIVSRLQESLGVQADEQVALLTGTLRGHERDRLIKENPVYRALLQHDSEVKRTVYLVSTSAGEVGIDLDADHMVCDLTTLEAMIQRLGRVNRRGGEGRTARVDVVLESKRNDNEGGQAGEAEPTPLERAEAETRSSLEKLAKRVDGGRDASPRAVHKLLTGMSHDEKQQAFAPRPATAPLTDILLDAWALTSIREVLPGRPEVAPYLHGLTADPPDTYVAWRSEMKCLAGANVPQGVLREWFRRCRIEARERVRDRTDRVLKELQKITKRHGNTALPIVVLTERGDAELLPLHVLLARGQSALAFRTIVLPIESGGLTSEGLLDGGVKEPANDVVEADGRRTRRVIRRLGDTYWHWPIGARHTEESESDVLDGSQMGGSVEKAAAHIARSYKKVVSQLIPLALPAEGEEDEVDARYLLLLVERKRAAEDTPESGGYVLPPTLDEHSRHAAEWAEKIASALGLEALPMTAASGERLRQALVAAARWHDRGKDRSCWQRSVFNETDTILAKPGPRGMNWRVLRGYRHELGSLLEAAADDDVGHHQEAELILHLIAAHHGRARPHFESDAWDTERHTTDQNAEAAQEGMRRFGRLQLRFGRWGLAWLESLVRCADALASRQALEDSDSPLSQETQA